MSFVYGNVLDLISSISLKSIFCTVILTFIFKHFIDKCRRDRRLEKFAQTLPGPSALPIIGNSAEFFFAGIDGIQKVLKKYSQNYGTTYRLWLGKYLVIAMSDVNDLEVIFKRKQLVGKPEFFRPYHNFWGNGLFTAPMDIWKTNRKRLQPVYSKNAVKLQMPAVTRCIEKYVEVMKDHVGGPEFDICPLLSCLGFDSITNVHFDVDFDENNKNYYFSFDKLLKLLDRNAISEVFMPWLRVYQFIQQLYLGKLLKSYKAGLRQFFKIVDIPWKYTTESSYEASKLEMISKSFLSTLQVLKKESEIEHVMNDEIALVVGTAADTTSATNTFLLLAISIHPEIQDKLYDEIFDVFGDSDRPADVLEIQRLPYLDQVVKETERRFTLVPILFRDVEEDCQIGSLTVPAGAAIMVRINDVHLNPDFYPNPYKFNPDNFSPEAIRKRSKYSFIPFSAGSRDCIGKNYLDAAVKLTIVALLRNYTFYTSMKMEDIELGVGFIVTKAIGYKLGVKLRDRRPSHKRK